MIKNKKEQKRKGPLPKEETSVSSNRPHHAGQTAAANETEPMHDASGSLSGGDSARKPPTATVSSCIDKSHLAYRYNPAI